MKALEPTPPGDRVVNQRPHRRLGRGRPITILLSLAMTIAACSADPGREDGMSQQSPSEAATDNELVSEALTFGGIALPPSAKVLAVDANKGIDQLYKLAIEIDPASIHTLLTESKFTTPLKPGRKVFMPPIQGFDPNSGSDIASSQDRLLPDEQRAHAVSREILVDRSNTAEYTVHIWLFTT